MAFFLPQQIYVGHVGPANGHTTLRSLNSQLK
jgi:hypothetical protein